MSLSFTLMVWEEEKEDILYKIFLNRFFLLSALSSSPFSLQMEW